LLLPLPLDLGDVGFWPRPCKNPATWGAPGISRPPRF
jgi:hypothetical protein